MRHKSLALTLVLAAGAVACGPATSSSGQGGDDGTKTPPAIEVAGTWDEQYAGATVITNDAWGPSKIVAYDDAARFAIVQSPADDPYTPNEFAKFVWTKPDATGFYYCIVDYGLATADLAKKTTKTADATDPSTSGCGGFSWTKMSPRFALEGRWDDNYGESTDITATSWGTSTIVSHDDAAQFAILQSPPDDLYTPNKFAKYVWTKPDAGGFWFCIVDFNLDSADAAKNTTKTADATHPDQSGCGGFAWTRMMPRFDLDGTWDDQFGETTTITSILWGTYTVVSYDDDKREAILQSPPDDQYTPNEFSKNVWTKPAEDGSFYFCTVTFGKASADDAKNATDTADDTDPANSGCGGAFAWTHMTKHAS